MLLKRQWSTLELVLLSFLCVAATHVGVDTTSTQTLSNKTIAGLSYTGDLTLPTIESESANFTVDNREHLVTTSTSDKTATLQAATGTRKVRDVCKIDTGSGHVVITRAGTDTIIYAGGGSGNTRTLVNRGDCDTLQDVSSGVWLARGDGT